MEAKTENNQTVHRRRLKRLNVIMGIALSVIFALTAAVYFVQAATVSQRQDVMTDQTISAASAHQISFKLSPGNTFAAGEQLTVDFPAQFTTGLPTWIPTDFSFHDGLARTITTVAVNAAIDTGACAGANNVGVAVDTAGQTFQVVACDSYSPSGPAATITFTIQGMAPFGTLVNPATTGSYIIYIIDAGGDCTDPLSGVCSLGVVITDATSVGVTATKPSDCGNGVIESGEQCDPPGGSCTPNCLHGGGGGGGDEGGGGGADTTAPVISGVSAIDITNHSATVIWTTNEAANSTVHYGLTAGYGSTLTDDGYLTDHARTLTDLGEVTLYHYKVCSADPAGNSVCSGDYTFTTTDDTPPVIFNELVTILSATSVQFTWNTDEAATSYIDYGTAAGPPYASTRGDSGLLTEHSVTLTGLAPDTEYNYRFRSGDEAGNESFTANATFRTPVSDTIAPVISDLAAAASSPSDASVTWKTDEPASSLLEYGKTTGYGSTQTVAGLGTSHSISLSGLDPNTKYFYRVTATDAANNSSSRTGDFTTPPLPAPGDVTAFAAVGGDRSVQLSWVNPIDAGFTGVLIVAKTGGYPTGPTDGRLVYDGTGTSTTDSGLTADTTYYYVAYAHDAVPAYAAGVQASAKTAPPPPDVTPPGTVTNLVAVAGDGQVRLTWTNPTTSDWVGTRIVRLAGADPVAYDNGTLIFEGIGDTTVDTFNIVNDTTYHYAAFAYDGRPNYADPARAQATPTAGLPEPPSPKCTDSDGGANYNVAGQVQATDGNFYDSCSSPSTLTEYYCDGAVHASEEYACGAGYQCIGGACLPEGARPDVCGDGICQETENSSTCLADCPVPPTQPEQPPEGPIPPVTPGAIPPTLLRFYVTSGRVLIRLGPDNTLTVFPRMAVTTVIPDEFLNDRPVKNSYLNFLGATYDMAPTHSLEATFLSQSDISIKPLEVVVNYVDGTSELYNLKVRTLPFGQVYEIDDQGHSIPVSGARVSLFQDQGGGNFGLWPAATYYQTNPTTTNENGNYGFTVPPGAYKLFIEKAGFHTKETMSFPISTENLVAKDLQLIRLPPQPIVQEITDILASDATTGEKAAAVAEAVQAQASYMAAVATDNVKEFVANPYVEQGAERAVTPIATAVAVANVASYGAATATGIPYVIYLYSLLMHPALLVARRKRRKWGIVFNSLTNLPLDLVIVRLLDAKTGRVVRSSVTDKDGRYIFMVSPGQYKITVAKAGYVFPTVFLKGQAEAGALTDLYHGDTLDIKEDTTLTLNIPVDSLTAVDRPRSVFWSGIARRAQKSVGIAAILFMVGAVIIAPKPFTIGMLCTNIIVYFVFQRLSVTKQPKSWGIVYDGKTKQPLRNALARIFEAKYNKLLETQVTDSRGHYAFLVGRNVYYVTFEKPGYTHEQKGPVDLLDAKKFKEGVINIDVSLVPAAVPKQPVSGLKPPAPPAQPSVPPQSPMPPTPPAAAPAAPAPAVPTPPKLPTPPAAAPAEKKIPWELQALKKGPTAAPPATPAKPPVMPPAPPVQAPPMPPVASSTVPAAAPPAKKISWEEQMAKYRAAAAKISPQPPAAPTAATPTPPVLPPAAPTPAVPTPPKPPTPPVVSPPLPPPKPPAPLPVAPAPASPKTVVPPSPPAAQTPKIPPIAAGRVTPQSMIQDVEHAHPDVKLVQDAEHAHPGEIRTVKNGKNGGKPGGSANDRNSPALEKPGPVK